MGRVNLNAVNLNLLVALRALLQERSVTRAARRAGVSQPAMSRSLAQLRQLFDDPLLVRVGHDMALTVRAAGLVDPLADVLERADALLAPQAFDPAQFEGRITLLLNDYTGAVWLPSFVEAVRGAAPGVDIDVLHPGREPFRRLAELDAWLVCDSLFDVPSGYEMAPLFEDGFLCLLRADHPAATGELDLDAYLSFPHALVKARGFGTGIVEGRLAALGKTRRVALTLPYFGLAPSVVATSDLILTVPSRLVDTLGAQPGVVVRASPLELPTFTTRVAWSQRYQSDPAHRWVRDLARTLIPDPELDA